ncbi:Uncharacterised protein [Yersinia pseudotuberculosis]|uniref:hypothetical protein n=1 Tax=Yersinia pseudotuberculosis TaxID=633 RepID=UPI0005DEFB60|nr:hypothetical protein [Yersinia pseudotuberculosis]CNK48212.1 Uncharacterised protein [Yersinia pseudotuberculosis]
MFPRLTDFVPLSILTPIKDDAKEIPVEPNDITIAVNNADKEENNPQYVVLDNRVIQAMIDKTKKHYDKESLTHLVSTCPLVEIGVRDRLQEINSPLQFPYSVNINVEKKPENGVVVHQHIVYAYSSGGHGSTGSPAQNCTQVDKPLIDIYCQIDVPKNGNLLHNLDIKLSIKFNEEVSFSLNEIFNPYDILRNIWGNIIKLYKKNEIDNHITHSDINFDDDVWVSDEDIALLDEFSKQKNNIEEPHKKLEFVYPEHQDFEWDDNFGLDDYFKSDAEEDELSLH